MIKIKKENINLLSAYSYKEPYYVKWIPYIGFIIAPLITLCLCGCLYFYFYSQNNHMKNIVEDKKIVLNDIETNYDDYITDDQYVKYQKDQKEYQQLLEIDKMISTYPDIDIKALKLILTESQHITHMTYQQEQHAFVVDYEHFKRSYFSELVEKMSKEEVFQSIDYPGYTGKETTVSKEINDDAPSTDVVEVPEVTIETTYVSTVTYYLK